MPVTRSSVLGTKFNDKLNAKLDTKLDAKDIEAAQTLVRFHYDMKYLAAGAVRHEHTMSLRGRKTGSVSTRPKRTCATYTPGMYAEEC